MGGGGRGSRIAVPRDDAVVAVEGRAVMRKMLLAADDEACVLQEVDSGVALGRGGVGPLVELLGYVDEGKGRGHADEDKGVVDKDEGCEAEGRRGLTDLIDVVADLAVRDCPGQLVMPLQRRERDEALA